MLLGSMSFISVTERYSPQNEGIKGSQQVEKYSNYEYYFKTLEKNQASQIIFPRLV